MRTAIGWSVLLYGSLVEMENTQFFSLKVEGRES